MPSEETRAAENGDELRHFSDDGHFWLRARIDAAGPVSYSVLRRPQGMAQGTVYLFAAQSRPWGGLCPFCGKKQTVPGTTAGCPRTSDET
jgi:hypothetical protein